MARPRLQSRLFSGDKALDEARLRGLLIIHGKTYRNVADETGIQKQTVCAFVKRRKNSAKLISYFETLSDLQDITVTRSY